MPAPRFDIYAPIHKGMRAFFAHMLVAVGRLDGEDHEEVAAVMAELEELLDFCRRHLDKENRYLHPALEARRPGATAAIVADHEEHQREIDALAAQAFTIRHLPALRRERVLQDLYRQLTHFIADNLAHMAVEERDNNQLLWETHSDAEIMAIEGAIVASQSQEEAGKTLRWMLPAMTAQERAGFLRKMQEVAPAGTVEMVLGKVRPHLRSADVRKLETALGLQRQPMEFIGVV
ncbi:MAG TPA: hemerythrin domain-containing protein [Moraxellaceae bacterium]